MEEGHTEGFTSEGLPRKSITPPSPAPVCGLCPYPLPAPVASEISQNVRGKSAYFQLFSAKNGAK